MFGDLHFTSGFQSWYFVSVQPTETPKIYAYYLPAVNGKLERYDYGLRKCGSETPQRLILHTVFCALSGCVIPFAVLLIVRGRQGQHPFSQDESGFCSFSPTWSFLIEFLSSRVLSLSQQAWIQERSKKPSWALSGSLTGWFCFRHFAHEVLSLSLHPW